MNRPELGPLRVIWSYKIWIVVITLVAAAVVWYRSDGEDRVYAASAQVLVLSGRQLNLEYVGNQELHQLTNVAAALANTRAVREEAFEGAATTLGVASEAIAGSLSVTAQPALQMLDFSARSGDPDVAAALANAYAEAFGQTLEQRQIAQRDEALERIEERITVLQAEALDDGSTSQAELQVLQQRAADLLARSTDSARIIQPALPRSAPVSPKPQRDALLAAIAMLVLSALAVSVWDRLRDRYSSAEDAAADLRLPVLGELPRLPAHDPSAMEALRSLRTSVAFALREPDRPLIMATSATPRAGKTYVVTNLARSIAAEGNRVVVIDGDLRRPTIHERLGVAIKPGIGDLVASDNTGPPELTAQGVAVSREVTARGGRLDAVTAGRHVADPAEALATDNMRRALMTLRAEYDFVLIDSPPVLAVADPVVLSQYADGVLLVVGARRERRTDVRRTLATLRAVNAPVIGLVFNSSSRKRRGYVYYGTATDDRAVGVRS